MKLTSFFFCCTPRVPPYSDEPLPSTVKTHLDPVAPPPPTKKTTAAKPKLAKTVKSSEVEPYSLARANTLFGQYADEEDPSVIGPEGFERLCTEAQVPLEGALPLVLAWQFGAADMAKISKKEWDLGTTELQYVVCSSLIVLP